MSKIQPNKIQKLAIETIDTNLSLRAGAGTGKTKVLTERYLNILQNGNLTKGSEFDEILAITFTNKAAEEMKGRILNELRLRKDEDGFSKLYKYFSKANIYTIHGFCTNIIKENPLLANVDPNFQVADDRMSSILLKDSVNEVLALEINNNILMDLLEKREDMNLLSFSEDLINLYRSIRNNSYPIKELQKLHKEYLNNIEEPNFFNIFELLKEYESLITRGNFTKLTKEYEYQEFFKNPKIEYLFVIEDSLGTSKGEDKERVRSEILEEINNLKECLEREIKLYYDLVFKLLEDIEKLYDFKKSEKSLLDYQDLQYKALDVIDQSDDYNYKYIMIDEFQDTDSLQAEIFKKLSSLSGKDANIFVVGDPKQSIYGFRGSDLEEYYKFTNLIKECNGQELIMEENYRSSKDLIGVFNDLFSKLLGDLYDCLVGKSETIENVKLELLTSDLEFEGPEKEAKSIANRVKLLIDSGEKPGEIAILFRRKKYIDILEDELLKLNISVNNTAQNFVKKVEIRDVIVLLKAISNKRDFLSLMSYLRSPMVGLNDNSLFIIGRYFNREEYNIEDKFLEKLEKDERILFEKGFKRLIKIKDIRPILSLRDTVSFAIKESGYFEIAPMLYGNIAKKNLFKFIDIAENFENEISSNLTEFFSYLEDSEIDIEEDDDAVNLITIHKSKGLEFENVIIAEMDKKFNDRSMNSFFEFSDLGLGFKFKDINSKYYKISKNNAKKVQEEELRMFYVATTRAKKRLILSFVNIDMEKLPKKTYAEIFMNSEYGDYEIFNISKEIDSSKKEIFIPEYVLNAKKELDKNSLVRNTYLNKVKKVKYYSASSYMTFKRSKEEYFRKYILGEEVITSNEFSQESGILDPIVRGNIVHRYAELNPRNVDEFIKKSLKSYGILESEENINLLKEQFANYNTSLKGKILYRELEFYYKVGNGVIHGYIDQVIEEDDGICIVDFKTSYNSNEELLEYYYPQLQIYAKAFEKISGKKVKKAKLLFLSNNEEYFVDISDKEIEKVMNDFEDYIDFVENNRELKFYID